MKNPFAVASDPDLLIGLAKLDTHGLANSSQKLADWSNRPFSIWFRMQHFHNHYHSGSDAQRHSLFALRLRQILLPLIHHIIPKSLYRPTSTYRREFLPDLCETDFSDPKIAASIFGHF